MLIFWGYSLFDFLKNLPNRRYPLRLSIIKTVTAIHISINALTAAIIGARFSLFLPFSSLGRVSCGDCVCTSSVCAVFCVSSEIYSPYMHIRGVSPPFVPISNRYGADNCVFSSKRISNVVLHLRKPARKL